MAAVSTRLRVLGPYNLTSIEGAEGPLCIPSRLALVLNSAQAYQARDTGRITSLVRGA